MSATKALRAPSKIASALDWKRASGSILSLDISSSKIGLALGSHPSYGEDPVPLESLPLHLESQGKKKVLSASVTEELQKIVKQYNVSSFVVNWPMEQEGRCGHACGKVLHTLDSLVESSNAITSKRPFCLWDVNNYEAKEDEWGRNPLYGEPCKEEGKTVYKASQERYRHDSSSLVAAKVMDDFMRSQWPEIYAEQELKSEHTSTQVHKDVSVEWLDNYEDTETYMSVAV